MKYIEKKGCVKALANKVTEPLFLNGHCLTMPERWTPKRPESSAVKIKTKNKGKQNKKRLGGDRNKRGQKRISYSGAHDGTDLASHGSAASRARGASSLVSRDAPGHAPSAETPVARSHQ